MTKDKEVAVEVVKVDENSEVKEEEDMKEIEQKGVAGSVMGEIGENKRHSSGKETVVRVTRHKPEKGRSRPG